MDVAEIARAICASCRRGIYLEPGEPWVHQDSIHDLDHLALPYDSEPPATESETQDASMGARIAREANLAQQRILELRERRASINAQIRDNLVEYGRLRRAAKLWEKVGD